MSSKQTYIYYSYNKNKEGEKRGRGDRILFCGRNGLEVKFARCFALSDKKKRLKKTKNLLCVLIFFS